MRNGNRGGSIVFLGVDEKVEGGAIVVLVTSARIVAHALPRINLISSIIYREVIRITLKFIIRKPSLA